MFKAYCSNHYIAVGDNDDDDVDSDKEESTGEEEGMLMMIGIREGQKKRNC